MSEWKSLNDELPVDGEVVIIKFKNFAAWDKTEVTFNKDAYSFTAGGEHLMLSPYWSHNLLWRSASTE